MHIEFDESFFNTIHLAEPEKSKAVKSCNAQESRILALMTQGVPKTPFEVLEAYNALHPEIPITSIRRAMTCLTKKGYLRKMDKTEKEMKVEIYNQVNHYWVKL